MKKQLIAKLLVLGMVLAMLPISALAVDVDKSDVHWDSANKTYYTTDDAGNKWNVTVGEDGTYSYNPDATAPSDEDLVVEVPAGAATTTPSTPDKTETPAEPETPAEEPVVVDTVEVKTETTADGKTVVTAAIEVADATAPVAVSEKALDSVVSQAKAGDVVSIVPATTGAVTVPATKLAEIIEKTGETVSVGNSVAAVAVNSALVELAGGAEVKIAPVKNADGTISVPVMAGDKEIAPEDVEGGIDVEVPADDITSADQVDTVNAVKADASKVELKWTFNLGKFQINLTVTGAIEIVKK